MGKISKASNPSSEAMKDSQILCFMGFIPLAIAASAFLNNKCYVAAITCVLAMIALAIYGATRGK